MSHVYTLTVKISNRKYWRNFLFNSSFYFKMSGEPMFNSKDEEVQYWKNLAEEYRQE